MVCYSYKDTRLSVFRPAASRNLNPCWSWPQADHGSSQHLHTALRPPWYLRPGEGRAGYQSKETSQAPSQLILILLGTNQQVLAQSPSLLPSINTLVSTALLSASHYLASFKHAAAKIVSGNFLVKTKEAFSTQTAAICRNFFWSCQCQAHGKYHNTWEMPLPSPAEHPSAQETHLPE